MWTQDMAAFGQSEVTTYASGRLGRVDDLDDPAAQPGSALEPAEEASEPSAVKSSAAKPKRICRTISRDLMQSNW